MADDPTTASTAPAVESEKVVQPATDADAAAAAEPAATSAPAAEQSAPTGSNEEEASARTDVNGHTDAADAPNGPSTDAQPASEDVTMQDADEPEADATPAKALPQRKATNGSAKKKSGGVPEHKSKKLNRKKSKPVLHLDAKPGQMYLARMKGHQPWPAIVCDEEMLPQILLSSRPVTTALPDGTYKRAEYADGGKRAHERTFPVMFLHTNEFAWMPNADLAPTTPEECGEAADKAKSKTLAEAYKVAAEGHDIDYFKGLLKEHEEYIEAEAAERAERESKKATKDKRKSDAVVTATADEMDVDEEKPKSKKRKKEGVTDEEGKPAKQAKSDGKKLKLTAPKTPKESAPKKTPASKSGTKKSAAKVGSDDDSSPKATEKSLTPAEAMEKKEKEVRYIRHKLQKGFLSRDNPPNEEEIKQMSTFLEKVENYAEIEGAILRATKIHKVLKAMIKLDSIPMDDTYHFTDRSQKLLGQWNKVLAEDPTAADKPSEKKSEGPESDGKTEKTTEKPADAEAKSTDGGKADEASETEPAKESEPQTAATVAEEKKADEPKADVPVVEKPAEPEQTAPATAEAAA